MTVRLTVFYDVEYLMIQVVFKLDLTYSVHAIDFYTYR